jgi:hypothetical protein
VLLSCARVSQRGGAWVAGRACLMPVPDAAPEPLGTLLKLNRLRAGLDLKRLRGVKVAVEPAPGAGGQAELPG